MVSGASGAVPPMCHDGNLAQNFYSWSQRLKIYLTANDLDGATEQRKIAILLNFIGEQARNEFFVTRQNGGERLEEYFTKVINIGLTCEFGKLREGLTVSKIIAGLDERYNNLKVQLISEDDAKLDLPYVMNFLKNAENCRLFVQQDTTDESTEVKREDIKTITTCENPSKSQISDLNLRLSKIEEWYGEYDVLQIEIESFPNISEIECEKEYQYREKFEIEYFSTVGSARELVSSFTAAQPVKDHHGDDEPKQINVGLSSTHCGYTLLSTALIDVLGGDGRWHFVRALLDNGSTSNFITEKLSKVLKLPVHTTSTTVEGLSREAIRINKRSTVTISSRTETYKTDISWFIISHITQMLPATYFDTKSLNIPKNIRLADPSFNTLHRPKSTCC
ncbi:unnamed protein product [Leptidea sinapis]|uniref:Uncharacterized protein n=1 Tax=Leptidea sinapis TaxID=189913 RepID=A0A5E4R443_9NEOP|nr:unnamed protein product [Leptidea sinapis]